MGMTVKGNILESTFAFPKGKETTIPQGLGFGA